MKRPWYLNRYALSSRCVKPIRGGRAAAGTPRKRLTTGRAALNLRKTRSHVITGIVHVLVTEATRACRTRKEAGKSTSEDASRPGPPPTIPAEMSRRAGRHRFPAGRLSAHPLHRTAPRSRRRQPGRNRPRVPASRHVQDGDLPGPADHRSQHFRRLHRLQRRLSPPGLRRQVGGGYAEPDLSLSRRHIRHGRQRPGRTDSQSPDRRSNCPSPTTRSSSACNHRCPDVP